MQILKKICPICALVSLTWLTLLFLKGFDYPVSEPFIAMLMGGSAVGISYTLSRKISDREMWWKLISIPFGFAAMIALLNFAWLYFGLAIVGYLLLWFGFKGRSDVQVTRESRQDIEEKLKNCC
ncbi:MAG: hypothetical protein WC250_02410 [Candidatus Paceibacterota bacterium]|jgi:hypothetical protein